MNSDRVLIAGARGVFGRRLVEVLLEKTDLHLVLAGRSVAALSGMVRKIGPERASAVALNLRDPAAVSDAAREVAAVCCTAGPFSSLDRNVVRAVVDAGAHWLDISDDNDWVNGLLGDASLWFAAEQQGVTVAPGLSSVPCISGICARDILQRMPRPEQTTVTLFIGNKNRKGPGSIGRALVSGKSGGLTVALPGRRATSFPFRSPDAALLQEELGMAAEFRVAFELTLGYRLFPFFKLVGAVIGRRAVAKLIALITKPLGFIGSDEGILQVECWDAAGAREAAWVKGRGQRMPVVPCAVVLDEILAGSRTPGVIRAWTDPDAQQWLNTLTAYGLECGGERTS